MAAKRWFFASIFLTLTTNLTYVTSQDEQQSVCFETDIFRNESLYRADLDTLLLSLSSNIGNTGFYNASVGEVNAIALCRADIQLSQCRGCVNLVAQEIVRSCPNKVQAAMWQQYCMVLYSNDSISGKLISNETGVSITIHGTVEEPVEQFYKVRDMLLNDLQRKAASGGDLRKAAAGNMTTAGNQTIYAMVQCRPDLSPENCTACFVNAANSADFQSRYPGVVGYVVYMPSCNIRYEAAETPFYNITRLQQPLEPSSPGAGNDNRRRSIIIIVVSVVVFLIVASCLGIFAKKKLKQNRKEEPRNEYKISSVESIQYDFGKIREATDGFSDVNKLGQGGFGIVYKGKLEDDREIAVKRLSINSCQGDVEFKNEVLLLANLQHRNLVTLLGFSLEGKERLLVYEFVQNGSLDNFLFDPVKASTMDWDTRYKIIEGIARGLVYLHEDSRLHIIHRDLKASNVLLDEKMNPKISDFGLAKLVMTDATHENISKIIGTQEYMAPEYAMHNEFSIKSDVYSFGVLILEIVTGQKKIYFQKEENSEDLISHAWRSWREGASAKMIDPILMVKSDALEFMKRCIQVALLCIQQNPVARPTMTLAIRMLNSYPLSIPLPSEPGFYNPSTFSKDLDSIKPLGSSESLLYKKVLLEAS